MKENGKGGKGQESSGLVGCGFVVVVQAGYEKETTSPSRLSNMRVWKGSPI